MKLTHIFLLTAASMMPGMAEAGINGISADNVNVSRSGETISLTADFNLGGMDLKGNSQIFITPVVSGEKPGHESIVLPSILINGRNMHYAWERGSLKGFDDMNSRDILREVARLNGKPQTESYAASFTMPAWMRLEKARIEFTYDSCGCGVDLGNRIGETIPLDFNPVKDMRTVMVTPAVTELPVQIHEGKARVQFEVNRTELHPGPFVCRNGQRIDNTLQLRMIDDSVRNALSDPNVEIASIAICGYASPESPYLHNEELATGRSRALAEYLADRYSLPREQTSYSSVPENWKEFREIVENSPELTAGQRSDLLELIDRPVYGPADYDAKEKELKTSPKFAKLYKEKILPEWFPRLRATTFAISTRLKPLSDEKLAEVINQTPEKMSLNQMFRVARLYPEGSDLFNKTIETALRYYPDSEVANLNAAAAAINAGDYAKAASYLTKAGNSPEADNLRGIVATSEGDFEKARSWFEKSASLPEATRNLNLLK